MTRRDLLLLALLAVLPVLAHAPAWWEGRLLGPGDTATGVAAPLRPLPPLAAESHRVPGTPRATAGLAVAIALLLLAGSPAAVGAGAVLVLGRMAAAHAGRDATARPIASILALAG